MGLGYGCLNRFGSCLRVAGRSTRHDPLVRPPHISTPTLARVGGDPLWDGGVAI